MYQIRLFHKRKEFCLSFMAMIILSVSGFILCCLKNYGSDIARVVPAYRNFVWLDGDAFTFGYFLIYTIPILAVLPFADSFFNDRSNNTLPLLLHRTGAAGYFFSKLAAVALSAFELIFIPLGLNFLLNFIAFPVNGSITAIGDLSSDQSWQYESWFLGRILFPELYVKQPYLYILVFLVLTTVFVVLCTVLVYELSFFIKKSRLIILGLFFVASDISILSDSFTPVSTNIFSYLMAAQLDDNKSIVFFAGMFLLPLALNIALIPFCLKKLKMNGGD